MRISDWSSDVCSSDLVADAGLHIPVGIDRAGIESLDLGAVHAAIKRAFTLALEHQPVDVAAEPRFAIPAKAVAALARLILGQVEHDLMECTAAMLLVEIGPYAFHFPRRGTGHGVMVGRRRRRRRITGRQCRPAPTWGRSEGRRV